MEKKNSSNEQEIKNSSFEQKKKKNSSNKTQFKDRKLPWWVELLFVQIGLPDSWLIKLLKTKKKTKDFYREEKKIIFGIFLFIFALGYFQPVINYSNTKLRCQKRATNYILEKSNVKGVSNSEIKMIAHNFCNGGNEIEKLGIN